MNKEVDHLHIVLWPFLITPPETRYGKTTSLKYEHVICCKLSKRQRILYEDFIASSETHTTLAVGNFLGLGNVLMQIHKMCNRPDLFEGRLIIRSFDML